MALTGGVASGKTAVSDRLAELGVPVIDTDLLAREVVAPGTAGFKRVVSAFGEEILDAHGALDRRRLREIVFTDVRQRRILEDIIHPLVLEKMWQRIAEVHDHPYVIVVVPLLIESGRSLPTDAVVVVDVPEPIQMERLMARDDIGAEQARAMIRAQADRRERLAAADHIIDNRGSRKDLERATKTLHDTLLERAGARQRRG